MTAFSYYILKAVIIARAGALPVDLVDGEALCGLLKDLKLGVKVRQVEEVEIEADFFEGV